MNYSFAVKNICSVLGNEFSPIGRGKNAGIRAEILALIDTTNCKCWLIKFPQFRHLICFLLPQISELFDLFRVFCSQIIGFRSILAQVVQLPGVALCRDEFPWADTNSAILLVEPPQMRAVDHNVFVEGRYQASAGSSGNRRPFPFSRFVQPGDLEDRG